MRLNTEWTVVIHEYRLSTCNIHTIKSWVTKRSDTSSNRLIFEIMCYKPATGCLLWKWLSKMDGGEIFGWVFSHVFFCMMQCSVHCDLVTSILDGLECLMCKFVYSLLDEVFYGKSMDKTFNFPTLKWQSLLFFNKLVVFLPTVL